MKSDVDNKNIDDSRRSLLKKAAYVVPAVVTLSAFPTLHAVGSTVSRRHRSDQVCETDELQPPPY